MIALLGVRRLKVCINLRPRCSVPNVNAVNAAGSGARGRVEKWRGRYTG